MAKRLTNKTVAPLAAPGWEDGIGERPVGRTDRERWVAMQMGQVS